MEDRLPYQTAALILVPHLDSTREEVLPLDIRRVTLHLRGTIQGAQVLVPVPVPDRALGPDLGLLSETTPIALSL